MSKKHSQNQNTEQPENGAQLPQSNSKILFYCGICAGVLSIVAFILAFFVLKVYGLIAAIVLILACLAFFSTQKKKNNFFALKVLNIIAYVLLGLFTAFFIGGIVYSSI